MLVYFSFYNIEHKRKQIRNVCAQLFGDISHYCQNEVIIIWILGCYDSSILAREFKGIIFPYMLGYIFHYHQPCLGTPFYPKECYTSTTWKMMITEKSEPSWKVENGTELFQENSLNSQYSQVNSFSFCSIFHFWDELLGHSHIRLDNGSFVLTKNSYKQK